MLGVSETFCFLLFKQHCLIMAQIVQLRFIPAAAMINIWQFKKNPFLTIQATLARKCLLRLLF